MRLFGFLLTGALLAAISVNAQVVSPPLLMASSASPAVAASTSALAAEPAATASEPAPAPAKPQGAISVFEKYSFQAYVGYTFLRFYEAPQHIQSRNGFDSSLAYYVNGGWFGVDGSLVGSFGSQYGDRSRFVFAGGGPRVRWAGERALEFWAHGLVGGSHYTPQTAYGNQGAFGYELGGGIDANAHHQRLAYRLEVDMIGTHYFRTYQESPKVSVGIVWKF